jgi:membrane dipeptidase
MNRREFSSILACAAGASLFPSVMRIPTRAFVASAPSPVAAALYTRSLVLDCNSGPPYEQGRLPLPQEDLKLVRDSGITVAKWSVGGIEGNFAEALKEIAYVQRMIEVHPEYFMQVRAPVDMERAKRENKLGLIVSFESAGMFEGKLQHIDVFRNLGVCVMQLSYNRSSLLAAGVMEPNAGGLTGLGKQAVQRMNALGIAIDISHANAQSTADTIATSRHPVIISHAGCAAVHRHLRNKTDEQLRALAQKGGVVGIFDLPFLTASPKQPAVDDYMAHLEHALKVAGEDHVGVGSDVPIQPFDTGPQGMNAFRQFEEERQRSGLAAPEEDRPVYVIGLNTPRRIELIADQLLKLGYSTRVAEKIIGANFVRVLTDIWSSA